MTSTESTDRDRPCPKLASSRAARWALIVSIVLTAILWFVPYGDVIGYPLLLMSTVTHELGHGLTSLLLGGSFEQLVIDRRAGGFANVRIASGWRFAAVAAGGLIGPAVFAGLCFRFGRTARGARTLAVLLALAFAGVILFVGASDPTATSFVDRWFGAVFLAIVTTVLLALALRGSDVACQFGVVFLAVQLALSVFSRSDYLFTSTFAGPNGQTLVSDTQQMANQLWLPYWVWGLLCGGVSVWVLLQGVRPYLRRDAKTTPPDVNSE